MIRTLVVLGLLGLSGWALTLPGGVIALLFVVAVLALAYWRLSLLAFTGTFLVLLVAYTVLGAPAGLWKGLLWVAFAVLALFNVRPLRKALVSRPFMKTYRRLLPAMSQTEREALEAGTVWWDGELFTGKPDWSKLLGAKAPQSRPSSTAPARSCAGWSTTSTSRTVAATCRPRSGTSSSARVSSR
jgi:hypothetical protein